MFANPLGLLALLAVPAIVALHLFRRRFQPRVVSALFLWTDPDATPLSGRKRDPLRRSLSLALEILAAVCLALALAGPRGCAGESGRHWVVVVDGSASMGARDPRANGASGADRTRVEIVRADIEARVHDLPRGSRVTIVESGARPRVIAGPAAFPAEALAALAKLDTTALHHDLTSAAALGLQLSGGGAVTCYTDAFRPDDLPPEVEIVAVGAPLENVAIVHATREAAAPTSTSGPRAPTDRIAVTIANPSTIPASTTVSAVLPLESDAPVSEPRTLDLAAHERRTFAFEVPRATGVVEVRLSPDALAVDDHAWLAPRPARVVGLRSNLDDATSSLLGLSSKAGRVARWLALVDQAVEAESDETAHLLLTDKVAGGPATWTLRLAPLSSARKDYVGPFLADKRHPLLEGTTLEGVVWSADPDLVLSGAPLVSAGNVPILVEERTALRREYVLDLDPKRSTLARSPDWPILLANLVEERRAELPGVAATNLVVGDVTTWRGPVEAADTTPYVLEGPGTRREHSPRATISIVGFDRPGTYAWTRNGVVLARFGVSFVDPTESDLTGASSGTRAASVSSADAPPQTTWIEWILIAVTLLALLADWWVLQRLTSRVDRVSERLAGPEPSGAS